MRSYHLAVVAAASYLAATASENVDDGFHRAFGNRASGNLAWFNGGDGIEATTGSSLVGNNVRDNTGVGLRVNDRVAYGDNAITSNTAGTVSTPGVNLGGNFCVDNGNVIVTCP